MIEVAGHLRLEMRAGSFYVEMDDLDIGQLICPRNERVEQDGWGRGGRVNVNLFARSDTCDGSGALTSRIRERWLPHFLRHRCGHDQDRH